MVLLCDLERRVKEGRKGGGEKGKEMGKVGEGKGGKGEREKGRVGEGKGEMVGVEEVVGERERLE